MTKMANIKPTHFNWRMEGDVAVISLDRPDRKNPLTLKAGDCAIPSGIWFMPMMSKRWCSDRTAAISALAGTCMILSVH